MSPPTRKRNAETFHFSSLGASFGRCVEKLRRGIRKTGQKGLRGKLRRWGQPVCFDAAGKYKKPLGESRAMRHAPSDSVAHSLPVHTTVELQKFPCSQYVVIDESSHTLHIAAKICLATLPFGGLSTGIRLIIICKPLV